MTITELKYVVALAKEKHFGRAAESVFVSQPTLSIGIKKLEDELGVKLFERLSNKALPTQVGEQVVLAAQKTLMSADAIRSIVNNSKGEMAGKIKIGSIYTISPYLLPKLVPALKEKAPNLKTQLEENYTKELINQLKDGSIDLAILSLPIPTSSLFEVKPLFEEEFMTIVPKDHKFEPQKPIKASDMGGEDVFLLGGGNCFRDQVIQACPQCLNDIKGDDSLKGSSLETIRLMVASGLGVSVFPKMAIREDNLTKAIPFSGNKPKRTIALAWRKSFIQNEIIELIESTILEITDHIQTK